MVKIYVSITVYHDVHFVAALQLSCEMLLCDKGSEEWC